ncbi:MAG: hypothetical protein KKD17_02150 [Nanoarchaeota archaeon]|nr:hypothetical protein [Nanoarchaeota archaeon]
MSSLDTDTNAIFAELERYALAGQWYEDEKEKLWYACGLDVIETNGQGTNHAHNRLSHLMAVYSAILASPLSRIMETTAIELGANYLASYPSSEQFFLPALLTAISRSDGGER